MDTEKNNAWLLRVIDWVFAWTKYKRCAHCDMCIIKYKSSVTGWAHLDDEHRWYAYKCMHRPTYASPKKKGQT